MLHYGLWFAEVERQLGRDAAIDLEERTWSTLLPIVMRRLGRTLGFEVAEDGTPVPLEALPADRLDELLKAISVNWLAADGVWFQSVERAYDIATAKSVNDTCWETYAPLEAAHIKRRHGLPEGAGLDALEAALAGRLYARINEYSIEREDERTAVLRVHRCRVQDARERKGLEDYPCKSGGLVEYRTFAAEIDPRITTECLSCPPDPHPAEYFCAWRFTLGEGE